MPPNDIGSSVHPIVISDDDEGAPLVEEQLQAITHTRHAPDLAARGQEQKKGPVIWERNVKGQLVKVARAFDQQTPGTYRASHELNNQEAGTPLT